MTYVLAREMGKLKFYSGSPPMQKEKFKVPSLLF